MNDISPDEIQAAVKNFWNFFYRKSKTQFWEMYLSSATVFNIDARRMELARLMWVRRERELFSPAASVAAKLGAINVQLLRNDLAVASYPFHLSVTREFAGGKRYHSEVPSGRATQVFQRDENGVLRIVHEHMSSGELVMPKELSQTDPPAPAQKP